MIADKKPKHKILRGAHEALRAVCGDFDVIEGMRVSFGCGCKFCDMGLVADLDGMHRGRSKEMKCTREDADG